MRRDHPDLEYDSAGNLKVRQKYLSAPGRSNMPYLAPGVGQPLLRDPALPVVITEGEFKTLALWRAANHGSPSQPRFLPLGVSGVYNWRGTIGKTVCPDGRTTGIRKSTAVRTLAGGYFTDELADLGSKDADMQTRGVWIIELSELDSLSHAEVARIKAFMSRTTDRFRPSYGMRLVESPRQCVFAGTVNHSTYLRDETGGRRFWPVVCGRIDVDALAGDRDQLWAEAKVRFESGCVWWLDTPDLVQLASDQQEARYEGDPSVGRGDWAVAGR